MRKPLFIETKETVYYNMEKPEDDYGQFCFLDDYDALIESIKNHTSRDYDDEEEYEDEMKKKNFSAMKYVCFQKTLYAITIFAAIMILLKFT